MDEVAGTRAPAYSVMTECLRRFDATGDRNALQRAFGARPMADTDMNWYRGALGELHVARLLERLGTEWRVLHSLQFAGADTDVDHIVIGPTGVYCLNTKNHSGQKVWVGGSRILVNGQKTDHIRASKSEAKKLQRELDRLGAPVSITAVLVIVDPARMTLRESPEDVRVVTSRALVGWLRRRHRLLTAEQIQWLADRLDASPTWETAPLDGSEVKARFERLDRLVRQARFVRVSWLAAFTLAAIGTAVVVAFSALAR